MAVSREELKPAYEAAGEELVEAHNNLVVPSSTPVVLRFDSEVIVDDVDEVMSALTDSGKRYVWVSAFHEHSHEGRFYIHTRILDEDTGDQFVLKADSDMLRLFPREKKFSIKTVEDFANFAAEALDVGLTPKASGWSDYDTQSEGGSDG